MVSGATADLDLSRPQLIGFTRFSAGEFGSGQYPFIDDPEPACDAGVVRQAS